MSRTLIRVAVLLAAVSAVATVNSIAVQNDTAPHIPPGYNTFVPPPKGQGYTDPVFGTKIWRVTDAVASGHNLLSTEYASQGATNADDTIVRIISDAGGMNFFSTTPPFPLLRTRGLGAASPSDLWWHPTDPNILYHLAYNGDLGAYNFATDTDTVVARFPYSNVDPLGENQFSLDGNRIASTANSGNKIFVYELSSDSIIAEFDSSALWIGDVTISPNGSRVLVSNRHLGGPSDMYVYTIGNGTLNFERDLGQGYGHKDVGQSPGGEDYLIADESWWTNYVRAIRLSDGAVTNIFPLGWNPAANAAMHISANSMFKDGWVYISTYSPQDPDPQVIWPTYLHEVFRVSYDGAVIERLAHNRTRYNAAAGDTYYAMPRATISRSGRLLFFASNMRQRIIANPNLPRDYADTYMMYVGGPDDPSVAVLDGLGGVHAVGPPTTPLSPYTPYFGWDAAVDLEFSPTGGYYMLDKFGYVHAGGGAATVNPQTPYFGWDIARDLEISPTGGIYVLDGFGGVHTTAGATVTQPSTYIGWDIAVDLELLPTGGFYVLDGFGGVHVGNGASITTPSVYIGWDIARDLELAPGGGYYVLDGYGSVHSGDGAPSILGETPFFGYDFAVDLEFDATGYYVLDARGNIHIGGGAVRPLPGVTFGWNIARDLEVR